MKKVILLSILCINTFAIVTKDCPSEIALKVTFHEDSINAQSLEYDRLSNGISAQEVAALIEFQKAIIKSQYSDLSVKLTDKRSSTCYYKGQSDKGNTVYGRIEGSTGIGSLEPARLKLEVDSYTNWDDLNFVLKIESMNGGYLEFINQKISLQTPLNSCDYGCVERMRYIGIAFLEGFRSH